MDRPHAQAERRSADAARRDAHARAGFAAARARRAAAARRRGALAGVLLLLTAAGWAAVALRPAVPWVAAAVPSALLVAVVVAGRAAVVAGHRNDDRWQAIVADAERAQVVARTGATRTAAAEHRSPRPAPRTVARASAPSAPLAPRAVPEPVAEPVATQPPAPQPVAEARSGASPAARRSASGPSRPHADLATTAVPASPLVGRAVRPSDAVTDVFDVIVGDRGETGPSVRHASGATPVVHASAAIPEADDHAWSPVPVPPPAYTLKPPALRMAPAPLPEDAAAGPLVPAADEATRTTGSIDLDAVLERRRASGL